MRTSTRISAFAFGLLLSASATAGAQDHVYNFNNTLADANGGPSLTATGGTLGANGFTFAAGEGLSLNGVFGGEYTVAMQFSFANVDGFRRIIDFKDRQSDTGPYVLNGGANFYNLVTGPVVYAPNEIGLTVFTRTQTGLFSAYFNGALQYQFGDADNLGLPSTSDVHFFIDDFEVGGEASAGFVNYIATWNSALSAEQVAALSPGGPVTTTPEPSSFALVGVGLLSAAFARNRRSKKV